MLLLLVVTLFVASSSAAPGSDKQVGGANSLEKRHYFTPEFYKRAHGILSASKFWSHYTLEETIDLVDATEEWEAPKEVAQRFPYYHSGFDEEERPIWIAEFGKYTLRETIEKIPNATDIMEKIWLQAIMRVFDSMNPPESDLKGSKQYVAILDFEGFDVMEVTHVPTIAFAMKVVRKYVDLMSPGVYKVVIINVNYPAELLLNLFRPLMGRFFERVEIYGTNKAKWKKFLHSNFPPEALPPWYGGSEDWKPVKVFG